MTSCNSSSAEGGYRKARALLHENFGDEFLIAHKYLEKLDAWPVIAPEDVSALDKFHTYVSTCLNMMENMNQLNQLNSLKEIKNLVMKLPYNMRIQFRKELAGLYNNSDINFSTFVKFVSRQLRILKLPLFGNVSDKPKALKSFHKGLTQTKSFVISDGACDSETKCYCCSKTNHILDTCIFFLKKSLPEREKFIKDKNICFGCLSSTDHMSKQCKSKLTCNTCKKFHPTSLHKVIYSKPNRTDGGNASTASLLQSSHSIIHLKRLVVKILSVAVFFALLFLWPYVREVLMKLFVHTWVSIILQLRVTLIILCLVSLAMTAPLELLS